MTPSCTDEEVATSIVKICREAIAEDAMSWDVITIGGPTNYGDWSGCSDIDAGGNLILTVAPQSDSPEDEKVPIYTFRVKVSVELVEKRMSDE